MRERVRSHTPFSHLSGIWLKGGLVFIFKSESSSTFCHYKTLSSLSNTTFFICCTMLVWFKSKSLLVICTVDRPPPHTVFQNTTLSPSRECRLCAFLLANFKVIIWCIYKNYHWTKSVGFLILLVKKFSLWKEHCFHVQINIFWDKMGAILNGSAINKTLSKRAEQRS